MLRTFRKLPALLEVFLADFFLRKLRLFEQVLSRIKVCRSCEILILLAEQQLTSIFEQRRKKAAAAAAAAKSSRFSEPGDFYPLRTPRKMSPNSTFAPNTTGPQLSIFCSPEKQTIETFPFHNRVIVRCYLECIES